MQLSGYSRLLAWHAMTLKFPHIDSHPIAQNSGIDSQTPENALHFAMLITLFSPLIHDQVEQLSEITPNLDVFVPSKFFLGGRALNFINLGH